MPRYKVLQPGFINGVMHSPGHPRKGVVHTDMPLKPVPSWLKLMVKETPSQKKSRMGKESAKMKVDSERAAQDKVDIDAVTFTESPNGVETL